MDELREYISLLQEDIRLLGYQSLRYSIFEGEDNNRQEYQLRMEYRASKFEVYLTGERASVQGKSIFNDFISAKSDFLKIMQLIVLSNRRLVKSGELPEYECTLWN